MEGVGDAARCATWTCAHVVIAPDAGSGPNIVPVGFKCPRCEHVSWSRDDLSAGYCGNCHAWTTDPHPVR